MGTDIHAVFQVKTSEGWKDIETSWSQDRHYALFGWLAGVHTGVIPIAERRGFPGDFTLEEGENHNGEWMGGHSHSWLTSTEILAAPMHWPLFQFRDLPDEFEYFTDEVTRLHKEHGEVRLVFGFDS